MQLVFGCRQGREVRLGSGRRGLPWAAGDTVAVPEVVEQALGLEGGPRQNRGRGPEDLAGVGDVGAQ